MYGYSTVLSNLFPTSENKLICFVHGMCIHCVYILQLVYIRALYMSVLDVGRRLQELRKLTDLSQAEIADALEKGEAAISHYETGRREMNFAEVYKYHEELKPVLGDNWLYVCTGNKLPSDTGSAYILKTDVIEKFAEFLDECKAMNVVKFKGKSKDVVALFARKYFAEAEEGKQAKV